jgi:hypothetical protein
MGDSGGGAPFSEPEGPGAQDAGTRAEWPAESAVALLFAEKDTVLLLCAGEGVMGEVTRLSLVKSLTELYRPWHMLRLSYRIAIALQFRGKGALGQSVAG